MTDGDREGECIAWSLVKFLKLKKGTYKRAKTHEIKPKAVVAAIENPGDISQDLVDAALARMILDKIIGYLLSPILKRYIGGISVGRCQSPALILACDRELEIQSFVPEKYIDLYLLFEKNGVQFKAKYIGQDDVSIDRIKSDKEADKIVDECGNDFKILDVSKRNKQESPKPPFSTATYQQEAASRIGLKLKDAQSCAQKLYEGGYITYHRTDDATLSDEFIPSLREFIEKNYGANAYTKPRVGKKTENAQEAHEALRVTDLEMTPEKAEAELKNSLLAKVYAMIWKRTVACAMPNAVIAETTYTIGADKHRFAFISNEIVSDGYRILYNNQEDASDDEKPLKETFGVGEKLNEAHIEKVNKETKPRARFSEATLQKELEENGIGRPSTWSTIVETVLSPNRNYSKLEGKNIVPTDLGMQVSAFLKRAFGDVVDIGYTKTVEKSLDEIANGKLEKNKFLREFVDNLEKTIENNDEINVQPSAQTTDKVCPDCGAPMVIRRSRFGKLFYGCSRYPKCRGIINAD